MQEVDWEKIWEKQFEYNRKIERKDAGIEYWNERADDYSDGATSNNYESGRKVAEALHEIINSNSEVLEIGAGPGTFVIPFAKRVKKVTAVEPSKGMVEMIMRNAEEEGIENFEIINKTWQEVDVSEIAGKYDLVICSAVLWIFKDVCEQLKRMEQASKGYCCIVEGTCWNKKNDELWYKVIGDEKRPTWSSSNIIYNILYARGRLPNIAITDYNGQRTPEKWIKSRKLCFDRYTELTPDKKKIIQEYILKNSEGGKYIMNGKTAVIWWKVQSVDCE